MSRGLGRMQREIMQACADLARQRPGQCLCPSARYRKPRLCFQCPLAPLYVDDAGTSYVRREVYAIAEVRDAVIKVRGCWCTVDCWDAEYRAAMARHGWHTHYPHVDIDRLGEGFEPDFSRACSSLLRRGALVVVTPTSPGRGRPRQRRAYLAQPKSKC